MRDTDRLKEKLEVSLDNRQIFYLFFGCAVVACLVFVVGVLVGKKLESRKIKRQPPAAADELALIDRDTKMAAKGLTFHDELIKPDARSARNVPPEVLEWRDMGNKPGASKANVMPVAKPVKPAAGPAQPSDRKSKAARAKKRYTLQVSAFQSKAEADVMLRKLQRQGYRPYVVASKLPRRGVWYRVRLGTFGSWDQAQSAKQKFEDKVNMTAYVSKR